MKVSIIIENGVPAGLRASWLRKIAESVLRAENAPADTEMGLVIAGQDRIRELNCVYRGKDRPTDVLAFALSEQKSEETPFISPPDNIRHLGEVLISYPQAVLQAEERHHAVKKELAILIIHGVLHLLGYDHEHPAMKRCMRAREAEILSKLIRSEVV